MSQYSITKATGKVRVGLDLEPSLVEELERIAEQEDRAMSNLVRVLIREALTSRKALA